MSQLQRSDNMPYSHPSAILCSSRHRGPNWRYVVKSDDYARSQDHARESRFFGEHGGISNSALRSMANRVIENLTSTSERIRSPVTGTAQGDGEVVFAVREL
jgi:hypothetical protein